MTRRLRLFARRQVRRASSVAMPSLLALALFGLGLSQIRPANTLWSEKLTIDVSVSTGSFVCDENDALKVTYNGATAAGGNTTYSYTLTGGDLRCQALSYIALPVCFNPGLVPNGWVLSTTQPEHFVYAPSNGGSFGPRVKWEVSPADSAGSGPFNLQFTFTIAGTNLPTVTVMSQTHPDITTTGGGGGKGGNNAQSESPTDSGEVQVPWPPSCGPLPATSTLGATSTGGTTNGSGSTGSGSTTRTGTGRAGGTNYCDAYTFAIDPAKTVTGNGRTTYTYRLQGGGPGCQPFAYIALPVCFNPSFLPNGKVVATSQPAGFAYAADAVAQLAKWTSASAGPGPIDATFTITVEGTGAATVPVTAIAGSGSTTQEIKMVDSPACASATTASSGGGGTVPGSYTAPVGGYAGTDKGSDTSTPSGPTSNIAWGPN